MLLIYMLNTLTFDDRLDNFFTSLSIKNNVLCKDNIAVVKEFNSKKLNKIPLF